jgi:pimeloyl-ACP methyl ester carboxylesterase
MESIAVRRVIFTVAVCGLAAASPARAEDGENSRVMLAAGRSVVREAADYSYRRWLRERIWRDDDAERYGLVFDKGWQAAAEESPHRPLVVMVHGFNSTPQRNAPVMRPVRSAGFPCATFAYPNDWDLRESAALLSRQLRRLAKRHPDVHIALVTHSMGGLVARACVENPELNPGNVSQLIMIAPPTHGTLLARLAVATDVWEHWLNRPEGGCWSRWRDSIIDGLGEAADDLVPESPFLTELNARPRNPKVEYSLFLGTGATLEEDELQWVRSALMKTSGRCPGFRDCSEKFDAVLADMDEIVDGKGDGVVALCRGRLAGVDDVVVLPFNHLNCTGQPKSEPVRQVQAELLSRLR